MPGYLSGNWVLGQPDVAVGTQRSQAVGKAGREAEENQRATEMVEEGCLRAPRARASGVVSAGHRPRPTHPRAPWAPRTDR